MLFLCILHIYNSEHIQHFMFKLKSASKIKSKERFKTSAKFM